MEQTGFKKSIINTGIWLSNFMRALSEYIAFIQVRQISGRVANIIEASFLNLIQYVLYLSEQDSSPYFRNPSYKLLHILSIGLSFGILPGPERPHAFYLSRREWHWWTALVCRSASILFDGPADVRSTLCFAIDKSQSLKNTGYIHRIVTTGKSR